MNRVDLIAWAVLTSIAAAGVVLLLRAMHTVAALASAQAARCLPYLP